MWESVAAHSPDHGNTGSRDEAEQSNSACVHREATGRDRTLLLSARTREHDDAGHAAAEPLLEMLDVQYNLRTQPGRVRCSTCRPVELRGCRGERGSHWGRRDTVPLNVQGQLKDVDQEVYLQLIYESRQRPENQITTLGLVPRHQVESGQQVTESFNIPEGFFIAWCSIDSQPTKSVSRRMRLAIERNIDEICPKRNPQSRLHHENLDVRSVGTTRPLRKVALFDETCDLTDEFERVAVRILDNHSWHLPNSFEKSFGILYDLVYMATRAKCLLPFASKPLRTISGGFDSNFWCVQSSTTHSGRTCACAVAKKNTFKRCSKKT